MFTRYQMNEEDINEALHKMIKNRKLLFRKDKNIQFYRFVESALVINLKEEKVGKGDGDIRLSKTINLLYKNFDCFKEEVYKNLKARQHLLLSKDIVS